MTTAFTSKESPGGDDLTIHASDASLDRGGIAFVSDEIASNNPPIDPGLLAAVPRPTWFSWDDLLFALDSHRILIVRLGGGIPYRTLMAIVLALLLHGALYLTFYFSAMLVFRTMHSTPDRWAAEGQPGGAGNGGFLIVGEDGLSGLPNTNTTPELSVFRPSSANAPSLSSPAQGLTTPLDRQVAMLHAPAPLETPGSSRTIGSLGTPRFSPPSRPSATIQKSDPPPQTAIIVPPTLPPSLPPTSAPAALPTVASSAKPVSLGGTKSGTGTVAGVGKTNRGGTGAGSGDDDEDGPVFDIMKPGTGRGQGNGKGSGTGNGINRGASGANLESPQPLDTPMPNIPLEIAAKTYKARVEFEVLVTPEGRPGEIKLLRSSGVPEFDVLCRAAVAKYRFRPAYHAGKPIAKTFLCSFTGPGVEH